MPERENGPFLQSCPWELSGILMRLTGLQPEVLFESEKVKLWQYISAVVQFLALATSFLYAKNRLLSTNYPLGPAHNRFIG